MLLNKIKKNKLSVLAFYIIFLFMVFALIGPFLTSFTYSQQILALKNKPPGYTFYIKYNENSNNTINIIEVSQATITKQDGFKVERRTFLLGSDSLGRDLFTRIWYGARISLLIGFLTSIIVFFMGTIYGGLSGYYGGWIDEIMMRILEVLSCIPFLLYVIILMLVLEPGLGTILISIGAVYWVPMARLVRGQIIALKEEEYIQAAYCLGAGGWRIVTRHLIPNAMGPILVYATYTIPEAIFTEALLSFLGLGVSAPFASWGNMISDGVGGIRSYPWQLIFPALFISITMLAFNIIGDSLRDAFDPRIK